MDFKQCHVTYVLREKQSSQENISTSIKLLRETFQVYKCSCILIFAFKSNVCSIKTYSEDRFDTWQYF